MGLFSDSKLEHRIVFTHWICRIVTNLFLSLRVSRSAFEIEPLSRVMLVCVLMFDLPGLESFASLNTNEAICI